MAFKACLAPFNRLGEKEVGWESFSANFENIMCKRDQKFIIKPPKSEMDISVASTFFLGDSRAMINE